MGSNNGEIAASVRRALSVVRRWWLLISIGTVLAMAVGTAASITDKAHHLAEAQVVVVQPAQLLTTEGEAATKRLADLMNTIALLGTSDAVLEPTRTAVSPERTLKDMRRRVRVSALPSSLVLQIQAEFPDEGEASRVASSVASQLGERLGAFAGSASNPSTLLTLEEVRSPVVQEVPASLPRTLIVAFVLGFGFSVLAAFALDRS